MSGMFTKPSMPTPPPMPVAPTAANSEPDVDAVARQQTAALQRGRTATMLTGGAGLSNLGSTSKVLLGQ